MSANNFSTTKQKVLKGAIRLMLERGFENTSVQMIADMFNMSKGNVTYHYHTKEDFLLEMTKEITKFHKNSIYDIVENGGDKLTAYCWEVAAQIILCHQIPQAKDLYLNIYSSPITMQYVKDWTAEKNMELLGERKPDWDYARFRKMVNVTCCIERSALTEPCSEDYTLGDIVALTLNCLMKLYDISKAEREKAIAEVLKIDEKKLAHKVWRDFIEFAENDIE